MHLRTLAIRLYCPLLLVWLSACGGDPPPAGGAQGGALSSSAALEEEPMAYRGILAMGLEERGFIPCGEAIPAWVEDATGGEMSDLYGMLAGIPNEPVYAELVGVMGDPPSTGPGARYAYGFVVSGIRQLSYGDEALECPEPEYGIVARGNEPDWALRIAVDGVEMQGPDLPEAIRFGTATERFEGGARIFTTTHDDGRVLELEVRNESCTDSMSGERFPFTATRRWEGAEGAGCAWGDG